MFDEGARATTIGARSDRVCYGLTHWDFRPVVEASGTIGWKLRQRMAKLLREARSA